MPAAPRATTLLAMSDAQLAALFSAGRAAWPDLDVDEATFHRHVSAHAVDGALPPVDNAGDLFLACACTVGASGAAAAFERTFRSAIERAVARVDRGAVDEGTQTVFVSLLVAAEGASPRIAGYSGRSSLRAWLATVASRATLKLHRRRDDQSHESLRGIADMFVADEPELALAKARFGPELADSLRLAVTALEPRQRVLLRLHHGQGWSVDRLGTLYRVGRSTAARWVAAARDALVDATKRDLRERLGLTATELESVVNLLRSNLEVSLVRLLDAGREEPTGLP